MDFDEVFEKWCNSNGYHQFEGESGVERFSHLCQSLGYGDNFQSPLQAFLCDNPGAIEAMIEFIQDVNSSEWKASLLEAIDEEE